MAAKHLGLDGAKSGWIGVFREQVGLRHELYGSVAEIVLTHCLLSSQQYRQHLDA